MRKVDRLAVCLVINLSIILMEAYALILTFSENKVSMFRYYTDISNVLAFIAAICYSIFLVAFLRDKTKRPPIWLKFLKYFANTMLLITFFVVVFLLAPMSGGLGTEIMLFWGSMYFHHLICPILSAVSFVFFEREIHIHFKDTFTTIAPTLMYGFVIITLNIARKIIGPYPFLHIYEQSVFITLLWFVIIILTNYLLGWTLYYFKRRLAIKHPLK